MGICADKDMTPEEEKAKVEKKKSKDIEKELVIEQRKDRQVNKLLLLGAGQSGKSTLFKQMNILYIEGFSTTDKETFVSAVHSNIMVSIQALCENSDHFGKESPEFKVKPELEEIKNEIRQCNEDAEVTEKISKMILALWQDPGIQKTYKNRSKFQLNDSTSYFFGRVAEVCKPGFVPNDQDVLRTRVPTTGIVENQFEIEGNVFKMFDVGGQRSERKKWIHCFEKVTAVLFVAAISAYDQTLYEDDQTNRMEESLQLFDDMSNNKWFKDTAMILFLNKSDIFREKIEEVPLENFFKEYQPEIDNKYESAVDFIVEMFESKSISNNAVYTHVTVATDSENIFVVFNAVKDIVIKKGLERAGLT